MTAVKFIKECTQKCSNELVSVEDSFGKKTISYHEWLTPEQALRAVELARDEAIQHTIEHLKNEAIETTIVDDWKYSQDPDNSIRPAIHQRIDGYKAGDKVKIVILKED